jgi:ATP-dependent helicase/nuclease subunit B
MQGECVYVTRTTVKEGVPTRPLTMTLDFQTHSLTAWPDFSIKSHNIWNQASPYLPPQASLHRLSVSDVDLLLNDSYGFYAHHILKVFPLVFETDAPKPLDKGKLLHKIFQKALENPDYSQASERHKIVWLHHSFHDLWRFTEKNHARWRVFWEKEFEALSFWFAQQPIPLQHQEEIRGEVLWDNTLCLYGVADRIDYESDRLRLIDYKTGLPPSGKDIRTGAAPQMLLEALMAYKGGFPESDKPFYEIEIWHMKGPKPQKSFSLSFKAEDLDSVEKQFLDRIQQFQERNIPFYRLPSLPGRMTYTHIKRVTSSS